MRESNGHNKDHSHASFKEGDHNCGLEVNRVPQSQDKLVFYRQRVPIQVFLHSWQYFFRVISVMDFY